MEWSESISEAINYIESHITEELTIADIAKQAIISPYYFQKGLSLFLQHKKIITVTKQVGKVNCRKHHSP